MSFGAVIAEMPPISIQQCEKVFCNFIGCSGKLLKCLGTRTARFLCNYRAVIGLTQLLLAVLTNYDLLTCLERQRFQSSVLDHDVQKNIAEKPGGFKPESGQ